MMSLRKKCPVYWLGYDEGMIGFIEGEIRSRNTGFAIVMAHGVGYKVALTRDTLSQAMTGATMGFWIYTAVREDALDLYGFNTEEELRLFELLLTVSGIGPRSALAILDIATVETLRSAIAQGNASYLTNVSGIGKKTAEKIVLELKDKMGIASDASSEAMKGDEEALEAMRAMGYSAHEARDALRKVPQTVSTTSARLREALKSLGSR